MKPRRNHIYVQDPSDGLYREIHVQEVLVPSGRVFLRAKQIDGPDQLDQYHAEKGEMVLRDLLNESAIVLRLVEDKDD